MSVTESEEKITELLNKAVRKFTSYRIARVMRTKDQMVRFWSCGERPSPIHQTLWYLDWLRRNDRDLYDMHVQEIVKAVLPEYGTLLKAKRLAVKVLESVLDDYRLDEVERAELEKEFKELVKEV